MTGAARPASRITWRCSSLRGRDEKSRTSRRACRAVAVSMALLGGAVGPVILPARSPGTQRRSSGAPVGQEVPGCNDLVSTSGRGRTTEEGAPSPIAGPLRSPPTPSQCMAAGHHRVRGHGPGRAPRPRGAAHGQGPAPDPPGPLVGGPSPHGAGVAVCTLLWTATYLTWRVGWSWRSANPVTWSLLLTAEIFGWWSLGTLTFFSWRIAGAGHPPGHPRSMPSTSTSAPTTSPPTCWQPLVGCRAMTYPHTTYLLDDGRRPEMADAGGIAGRALPGAPDNSHAKAGNINPRCRTEGELVLMLDADHVPMPDALDVLVGYFDDERMALVQTPHDFYNHDSVQHYDVGRHEQSVFYASSAPARTATAAPTGAAPRRWSTARPSRDRRRRHRDHRRGLPHHHPAAAPRLAQPLPRRGRGAGPGSTRPRQLPAATGPLGTRQPRRLLHPRVPPARPRAAALQRLSYFASLMSYFAPPMRLMLLSLGMRCGRGRSR